MERARSEGWEGSSQAILRTRRPPTMKPWSLAMHAVKDSLATPSWEGEETLSP